MRHLPLSLLRSLAAVHAEGGIRPAAKRLGVDHSAVSRAIRELQDLLGAPIMEQRRRGQGILLTPQAIALADASLVAMKDLEFAVEHFRTPTNSTHVTIATLPSIAARWLMPRLPRLRADYPDIEVSIVVDQPRGADINLAYDLTLRMGQMPANIEGIIILGHDHAFPAIAPSLWGEMGNPVDVEALLDMPLLHDRDDDVNWSRWQKEIGPADLDVRSGPRMTSSDIALQAAEQGQGVAMCRGWLVEDALSNGTLVRPFGNLAIDLPSAWWLYEGKRAKQNHAVRCVRDWLYKICESATFLTK